jgi:3-oxoadipate enol-lactonase
MLAWCRYEELIMAELRSRCRVKTFQPVNSSVSVCQIVRCDTAHLGWGMCAGGLKRAHEYQEKCTKPEKTWPLRPCRPQRGAILKQWLPSVIKSTMTKTPAKTVPEARLNWVRTSADRPETVVLIHAVGHDLTYWDRQIEALRRKYNVVALNLPGHGRSSGASEDWSFDQATAIVATLIEEVSAKPVHLVGISFGAMIAQVTTLARPDLVCSVALIGTASHFPQRSANGMRSRAETVRAEGMAAVVQSSLERWFTPETRTQRPDIRDRVTKALLADDPATHAAIWDVISSSTSIPGLGRSDAPH